MLKHRPQLNLNKQLMAAFQIAIMQDRMFSAIATRTRVCNVIMALRFRSIECRQASDLAIDTLKCR